MTNQRSRPASRIGALLWLVSVALTITCLAFQNRTGPTYPLEGKLTTSRGEVSYLFLRSETIGTDLSLVLIDPVPDGVSVRVRYRRYRSTDDWREVEMARGEFNYTRRGRQVRLLGLGTRLPSLPERAGKYEYLVLVDDGRGAPLSVTGGTPILARYKAPVPQPILLLHIIIMFASMALALRTTIEGLRPAGEMKGLVWATVLSLLAGGFVLGPIVQWYAFGVLWSGIPFGYDWTDNKVVLEMAAWLLAAWANRGTRRSKGAVIAAGLVTLIVYLVPHSVFGSEFDYTRGKGHGTAG